MKLTTIKLKIRSRSPDDKWASQRPCTRQKVQIEPLKISLAFGNNFGNYFVSKANFSLYSDETWPTFSLCL